MSAPPDNEIPDTSAANARLSSLRIGCVGKLGGVNRRELRLLVRRQGGRFVAGEEEVDWIVVGADESPDRNPAAHLPEAWKQRLAQRQAVLVSEAEFWERLGLVEGEAAVRRRYTPALLAQLAGVQVSAVRAWLRRGWLVAAQEVRRLPYFDFSEVHVAKRLAALAAARLSSNQIERQLQELQRRFPQVERPLADLPLVVQGRQLLLRREERLLEPGGQFVLDFDAFDDADDSPSVVCVTNRDDEEADISEHAGPIELAAHAAQLEEEGDLQQAADMYRAALASGGLTAELCFQLAETLYRLGDLPAARERYFMALEIDEEFVEARANVGCLLADMGEIELAIAALEGALAFHPDYADAHYHLARLLDQQGRNGEAETHWVRFLECAPDSPWADEALDRLEAAEAP